MKEDGKGPKKKSNEHMGPIKESTGFYTKNVIFWIIRSSHPLESSEQFS